MKKYLYSILSLAVGLFSSCSSVDNSEITENHTTLTLSVEGAMSTRSTDGVTYYVEAYTNDTYSKPANIFSDNKTNKVSNATGSISMILDRSEKYYFLFFATKDASCYDARDLKAIALQSGKNPSEAWFGITKIDGKTESVDVELKRCVAKLSLIETGIIPANSELTLTFDQPTKFDVSTGNTSTDAARTETISLTDGFTSSSENKGIINSDDIFVLASSGGTGDLSTLTFQMSNSSVTPSTEDAITVTNVPFKANHNTNIKGHYTSLSTQTFTVTADDAWNTSDNDVPIGGSSAPDYTGIANGHEYVDLGLPSGTMWATMNVGASSPEDFGDYFAWGETKGFYSGKTNFNGWTSYTLCNGDIHKMTKYCTNSTYGTVDNKTTLDSIDDAAAVHWGGIWRMPTLVQLQELDSYCTHAWTSKGGVEGIEFTSKENGASIFLPATGYYGASWSNQHPCTYCTSTVSDMSNFCANSLRASSSTYDIVTSYYRYSGRPVRAVCCPKN